MAPHYPTDLTDGQWSLVERQVSQSKSGPGKRGRPSSDLRRVVNGILYVNKTGCQWRMLPSDFGLWPTVYGYFYRWSRSDVWKRLMNILRSQKRQRQGRRTQPPRRAVWIAKA
jgi:transposase